MSGRFINKKVKVTAIESVGHSHWPGGQLWNGDSGTGHSSSISKSSILSGRNFSSGLASPGIADILHAAFFPGRAGAAHTGVMNLRNGGWHRTQRIFLPDC
jgi:hypothetical protein